MNLNITKVTNLKTTMLQPTIILIRDIFKGQLQYNMKNHTKNHQANINVKVKTTINNLERNIIIQTLHLKEKVISMKNQILHSKGQLIKKV